MATTAKTQALKYRNVEGKHSLVPSQADDGSVPEKLPPPSHPTGRLLWFDELPHWLRDNHYIHGSYRPPSYSIPRSLRSMFRVHNETVNIQSHLWGAVSFGVWLLLALSAETAVSPLLSSLGSSTAFPPSSVVPFIPFLFGAAVCLTLSALFHATSNVSPRVAQIGNQLDYVGIAVLIAGSFLSAITLGFRCDPRLWLFYASLMLSLSTACIAVTLLPAFRTPSWRPIRAALFVGLGLVAAVPAVQGYWLWGWAGLDQRFGATELVIEGVLYITGAGMYAVRWPERQWPGKLDIVGSSHQWFHLLVVTAAWTHMRGMLRASAYWDSATC